MIKVTKAPAGFFGALYDDACPDDPAYGYLDVVSGWVDSLDKVEPAMRRNLVVEHVKIDKTIDRLKAQIARLEARKAKISAMTLTVTPE